MNPHLEAYASKIGKANGLTEAFNGNDAEETENKFREVSHSKQGCSAEIPAGKMSELMKLNSLQNSSTQSLFSVVNKVLDDNIERKNGDIPHCMGFLLKKVVQEIEWRVSTQIESFKKQNNHYKILEEKYQSRIRVLETLATGTLEENEVVMNQLQQIKNEKTEIEEKKKLEEQDVIRLMQEKDHAEFQISALKQQLELAKKTHEMHCFQLETQAKETKVELEKKLMELEYLLTDSRNRIKDLEAFSESKSLTWKKKELTYKRILDSQSGLLQDLSMAFWAIKREVLKTQKVYSEEFCHLAVKLKGLVDAAENYHTILVENRKLYNEVQDLKGNIRVYCRIRPFLPGQSQKKTTIEYIGENGELVVANPLKQGKDNHRLFKFNKVFGLAATQEEVFLDTQPLIRSVLDGYNVCIFAYGQTGSGKTYTMSGPTLSTEDLGVNYRALNDLFHISQSRKNSIAYEVCVQMVEIYNELVRDLLSGGSSQKRLGIWNTTQPNGLAVPDASIHPVKSTEDILELMNIGLMNRAVGSTALNERSSRSHSVLTVHVRGIDLESDTVLSGCLHLVDLAGSERVDRSEATGDRLREAQHINKSLSALGDVIFSLAQKSPHVPYRNSKLTQVLQSSLGGQAKTLMFVQLNPDVESYSETISTLKFAERVSGVELGAAQSNKEGRGVRELMEQVASLKNNIAKKDEEIGRLRLLKTGVNGERRGMSSPRYGSSSPRRHSIGAPRQSRTPSGGKSLGLGDKAVSDLDNSSEYSDKQSEDGSQQSTDDFRHHKEFFRQSRFSMANGCQSLTENIEPRLASADGSQDIAEDIELLGLGDADADKRLSDISDGELSMGTETDGSLNNSIVEFTLFPETAKPVADSTEKPSVAAKLPRPPPKQVKGVPSRLSLSRLSLKVPSSSKKSNAGGSSSTKRWQ
ncbi:kinesin-like protein KIN-14J isoform X2 [Actinidia eriantha]|uniref:kinesin-like protein KIN-14J isoform X2 n=1 Tax=Actinidia eriantha TaxID=165200 RepID=UPI002589486C|nr:kinesin-like protein KIN-14J isoform X2 [Actinidia eriantha]